MRLVNRATAFRRFRPKTHCVLSERPRLRPSLEASIDNDMYQDVHEVRHVELGANADLIVVAPATANFLAKLANGIADDLLMNAILASTSEIYVCPAMHTEMWQNPATQANVATLRARGINVMEPASGRLTGTDTGPGRLPETEEIRQFRDGQKTAQRHGRHRDCRGN